MPDRTVRENILARARRVVVKVGTSSLTDEAGRLDTAAVRRLAGQLAQAIRSGLNVTLVASGAVGAGLGELDLPDRPKTLPLLQAVAAVGQGQLIRAFHDALKRRGVKTAQVLLTRDDFEDRTRYLNIRNTLNALHELGVLPILNENDAVAVDELRFGDNDIIAAHVTNMLAADVLVLLTAVDGVLDGGEVLDVIEEVNDATLELAEAQKSRFGSGGMASKLQAAGLVTRAGEAAVVANARTPDVLGKLLAGKRLGTVFVPARRKLASRKRWIGQAARPRGTLHLDAGAVRALTDRGTSLLPSGITGVEGEFGKGDTVALRGPDGREIARGLVNYPAGQVREVAGLRSSQIRKQLGSKPYDEIVHRDNLTLL